MATANNKQDSRYFSSAFHSKLRSLSFCHLTINGLELDSNLDYIYSGIVCLFHLFFACSISPLILFFYTYSLVSHSHAYTYMYSMEFPFLDLFAEALRLSNNMQWHRPVTSSSSSTTASTVAQSLQKAKAAAAAASTLSRQMNSSNMPFRELLLQQQQQQQNHQQNKLLADSSKNSLVDSFSSAIASGAVTTNPLTNTEIGANAIISSAVAQEQDRIALASHFQERDRLILQHQQHQLQRKQNKNQHHEQQQQQPKPQLNEHEKPFSISNRIGDFVIGGGVDGRVSNIAVGKTSGKFDSHNLYNFSFNFRICQLPHWLQLRIASHSISFFNLSVPS